MAKLSRTALKGLVKECLVEILAEGIGLDSTMARANLANSAASLNENKKRTVKRVPRRSSTDNMRVQAHNNNLVESLAGTNPVMRDIFNDTLKNTITAQSNVDENSSLAQRTVHGDGATKQMLDSDPMSLFEGSSNWASLAFSSTE
jgi:hypothetical protein